MGRWRSHGPDLPAFCCVYRHIRRRAKFGFVESRNTARTALPGIFYPMRRRARIMGPRRWTHANTLGQLGPSAEPCYLGFYGDSVLAIAGQPGKRIVPQTWARSGDTRPCSPALLIPYSIIGALTFSPPSAWVRSGAPADERRARPSEES